MDLKKEFGLRLVAHRTAARLSQEALAARIEKSRTTIRNLESGTSAPKFETIEALSRALKVPPSEFFPSSTPGRRSKTKKGVAATLTTFALQLSADDAETLHLIAEALYALRNRP